MVRLAGSGRPAPARHRLRVRRYLRLITSAKPFVSSPRICSADKT